MNKVQTKYTDLNLCIKDARWEVENVLAEGFRRSRYIVKNSGCYKIHIKKPKTMFPIRIRPIGGKKRGGPHYVTGECLKKIKESYQHMSVRELIKLTGKSETTIRNWIKKIKAGLV